MKRNLIVFALCICLLLGTLVCLSATAQGYEAVPSFFLDFTNKSIAKELKGVGNMTYEVSEGEHCTFTATANDPSMELPVPEVNVCDAAYLAIEYRTTSKVMGEIYIARTDGVSFSQDPASHLEWTWDADGEWHKIIVRCDGWADVQDVKFAQLRFDPLHLHQGIKVDDAIELRYFAFFDSEEKAQAFDLTAYQEYEKQEQQKQEEA